MGTLLRISTRDSDLLKVIVQSVKFLDKSIQANIRKYTKEISTPEWRAELQDHVETRLEQRVLVDTARVSVSNQNVMLKSATVGRSMQGGAKPSLIARGTEFGADPGSMTTYKSRRAGREFSVTRHTKHQFRPIIRKGYVVYPSAARIIPRIASLWVQTVVRTIYEVIEGKSS